MATPLPNRLVADPAPGSNAPAVSVSELAHQLKRTVEEAYDHVRVRGEVSGWKRHASGHCYFTLKDDRACLDAVIWKGSAGALRFRPEDGLEVVATGRLTTYPGRSRYQVIVDGLELAGAGALMALLDRRRRALAAEGLFAEDRKRPLPFLPRTIGVVTSPTGAVIRDILHRLAERCPTRVLVWPVPVQGEGAAEAVAAAVTGFGAMGEDRPDLLIVARGGGSIEDLWAFNEEIIVRAVAASAIPVISAVGHETDTTLCDHAADRRAPTPTAAAEMAVPVRADLLHHLDVLGRRMGQCALRAAERRAERLELVAARWPTPATLLDPQRTRATDLAARLPRALRGRLGHARSDYQAAAAPLRRGLIDAALRRSAERVMQTWRLAELAHPARPLSRGYARVEANGRTVTSAAAAGAAPRLTLHFGDGALQARPDAPRSRPRALPARPGQLDFLGDSSC